MKTAETATSIELFKMEKRIGEALGSSSRAEIAAKMGVKYATLSNWVRGRTEFPVTELAKIAKLTDFSLNWILTGEGEKRTAKQQLPQLFHFSEDNLVSFIRGVISKEIHDAGIPALESLNERNLRQLIRSEIAEVVTPAQEFGLVDAFDINAAIERWDDPHRVMEEWLRSEGLEYPRDYGVMFFDGWEGFTTPQKVDAIKDARKLLERTLKKKK